MPSSPSFKSFKSCSLFEILSFAANTTLWDETYSCMRRTRDDTHWNDFEEKKTHIDIG